MYLQKTRDFFSTLRHSDYRDAIVTSCEKLAIQQAGYLDSLTPESITRLPLAGKLFTVKDNIDVGGYPVCHGNPSVRYPATNTHAGAIQGLIEAGAILVGKTLMNEFAAGLDGKNAFYPPLINPNYPKYLVGGSSSGGAVSVAAGLVDFAIGTDTGGSIRIPACWTGSYGLRLAISDSDMSGVFPRSTTFDSLGIITKDLKTLDSVCYVMRKSVGYPSEIEDKTSTLICFDPTDLEAVSKSYRVVFNNLIEKLRNRYTVIEDPIAVVRNRLNELALTVLMYEFHREFSQRFPSQADRPHKLGTTVLTDLNRGAAVSIQAYHQAIMELREGRESLIQSCQSIRISPLAGTSTPQSGAVFDPDSLRMFTFPWSVSGLAVLGVPVKIDNHSESRPDGLQLIASENTIGLLSAIAKVVKD